VTGVAAALPNLHGRCSALKKFTHVFVPHFGIGHPGGIYRTSIAEALTDGYNVREKDMRNLNSSGRMLLVLASVAFREHAVLVLKAQLVVWTSERASDNICEA